MKVWFCGCFGETAPSPGTREVVQKERGRKRCCPLVAACTSVVWKWKLSFTQLVSATPCSAPGESRKGSKGDHVRDYSTKTFVFCPKNTGTVCDLRGTHRGRCRELRLSAARPTTHGIDPWILQPETDPSVTLNHSVSPFHALETLNSRMHVPQALSTLTHSHASITPWPFLYLFWLNVYVALLHRD